MKILLLEDDLVLGETIDEMLFEAGYDSVWVKNGEKALDESYEGGFDMYIFDINVPQINGIELLKSLREANDNTPTIFISALTDISSIAKGFNAGADDYLKKPFYPQELLFHIEAKLNHKKRVVAHDKISYDPTTREVSKDGLVISLGEVQLALLEIFITNAGRTIDKEMLFEAMEHPSENALRFAINKLRHTTEWDIQNIRGIGYRIEKS